MDISAYDRDLAIRTMIGEARNQGDKGLAGVGAVILNRVNAGNYGKSIGDVVLARNQFEPWMTRRDELLSYSPQSADYQRAGRIFDGIVSGQTEDPTGGATHFLNPDIVRQRRHGALPGWASGEPTAVIGAHAFYTPGPRKAQRTEPDLLSTWSNKPAAAAPAESGHAVAGEDDLLGHWAPKNAPTDSVKAPAAAPKAASDGTPAQLVSDLVRDHQGEDLGDSAIRAGAGIVRGIGDVADTIAKGITYVGDKGANALAEHGVISPETAQGVADWRGRVNANIANDNSVFDTVAKDSGLAQGGRIAGQIAGTAPMLGPAGRLLTSAFGGAPIVSAIMGRPLLATAVRGGAAGAGANALTSATSDEPLMDQIQQGGAIGGVLGPVGYGAARLGRAITGGPIGHATAALADRARNAFGIPVTAGQMSENPMVRFADSVLQRLPFSGYGARTAEQRTAFNRAVSNTFGEDAPSLTHDVVNRARDRIGDVFDDVANRTGNIRVDQPFASTLQTIVSDARDVLGRDAQPVVAQVRRIADRIDHSTGTISAESYQSLTRKGTPLDRAMKSNDPNVRHYAGQIRDALDDVMQRSAPADAVQDLLQARRQWKALKTVEPLVDKAVHGNISPADLLNKVNKSYSGGRAGGGADLRDLGEIGKRFLQEPPSSGTSERLLSMEAMRYALGAGGLAGAYAFDPENFQRNALLTAGGITGGRMLSRALRSDMLAESMIRRGLNRPGGFPIGNALDYLPAAGALSEPRSVSQSR